MNKKEYIAYLDWKVQKINEKVRNFFDSNDYLYTPQRVDNLFKALDDFQQDKKEFEKLIKKLKKLKAIPYGNSQNS